MSFVSSSDKINPIRQNKDISPKPPKDEPSNSASIEMESSSVEGSSFDGSSVLDSSAPKTSKLKKIKNAAFLMKDKAEFALGVGLTLIDQGRAVHGIAQAFFAPIQVLDKIFIPLRFLSWTAAPFVGLSFVNNGVDFFTTPGFGKILPVMKSIVDVGIAAEMAANCAYLLEDIGIVATQNIAAWAAPLGGVAIGLQSVAIAINGWGMIEVANSLRRLQSAINANIPGDGYAKAVDLLTKKPVTKLEKFRFKFFKVLSSDQDARIVRIHEKVQTGDLNEAHMKKALDAVKHRFHLKGFGYGLAIVASVAGIIGVAILIFGPGPIAPIGWLFIAMSATTSLTLVGLNIYANKRLNTELKMIDPEPLPGAKPPFYKRIFKKVHHKLKQRKDGSTEIVDDS